MSGNVTRDFGDIEIGRVSLNEEGRLRGECHKTNVIESGMDGNVMRDFADIEIDCVSLYEVFAILRK